MKKKQSDSTSKSLEIAPKTPTSTKFFSRKVNSVLLIFCIAIIFSIHKILYYSADPVGEKDCDPIDAVADTSQTSDQLLGVENPFGALDWKQKGGKINDVSCLNRTTVHGIIEVRSQEDVEKAVAFARDKKLTVSIAGVKHSMGGHAFAPGAIVLDMTKFNTISLNEERKTVTVQSGATWHDIQNIIHPKYAIKAMQSTDIFTVGGSISVNAHGMDHTVGSVGGTVRSLKILLADGSVKQISKESDPELFNAVVGGYGLFGVILEAELDITDNEVYDFEEAVIPTNNFLATFESEVADNTEYSLFYGHLSTAPSSFLDEMILYKYKKQTVSDPEIAPLAEVSNVKLRRFVINFAKTGWLAKEVKWFAEKNIEPMMESCTVNRNQAMKEGESCLISRNDPMHDSVPYTKNNLKNDTDILQEYFIPQETFPEFVAGMKKILTQNHANTLNVSVRVVHKEDNLLSYATEDNMFAIVLYLNQTTDSRGSTKMTAVSQQLIELTTQMGGKFFLPYQLNYTAEQLQAAYPVLPEFFAAKRKYDPDALFTNTFYEKYSAEI